MNLQYLLDKSGHATAVQLQIPIEEWDMLKKKYKEFEKEEQADNFSIPEWHLALIKQELTNIADGSAGLIEWDKIKDSFKI